MKTTKKVPLLEKIKSKKVKLALGIIIFLAFALLQLTVINRSLKKGIMGTLTITVLILFLYFTSRAVARQKEHEPTKYPKFKKYK